MIGGEEPEEIAVEYDKVKPPHATKENNTSQEQMFVMPECRPTEQLEKIANLALNKKSEHLMQSYIRHAVIAMETLNKFNSMFAVGSEFLFFSAQDIKDAESRSICVSSIAEGVIVTSKSPGFLLSTPLMSEDNARKTTDIFAAILIEMPDGKTCIVPWYRLRPVKESL
jgi:hypothetical protein